MADTALWPQIGDIVHNHEGGRPDPVADLQGQGFDWTRDDGLRCRLAFDAAQAAVQWTAGDDTQCTPCEVFAIRPGLYFVDAVDARDPHISHSFVLDLPMHRVVQVDVEAPVPGAAAGLLDRIAQRGSWSAVDLKIRQGCLDSAAGQAVPPCPRTSALVGHHYRYHYSDTHIYDHIYVSERYYSWFCHRGPDAGVGDFEECQYLALGPDLFLVCWTEKLIPCVGVTVEDLQSMRSIGKIFGADAYTGVTANRTVGAAMSLVATFALP